MLHFTSQLVASKQNMDLCFPVEESIWSRLPKKTSWPKKGRIKTTLPPAYVPITGVCLFNRIKYVYPEYPRPFHLDPLFEASQRVGLSVFWGGHNVLKGLVLTAVGRPVFRTRGWRFFP